MRRIDDAEIEFADYFPSSRRDPGEMWDELRATVAGLSNPHLKALLEAMLDDPDIAWRYRRAPAAKQIHHAYLGGLIEHVLSLCALARAVGPHYPNIDLDLLLTGVVLHDIGKIYELNYERGFSYSSDGQLIGHISIGLRMVAEKLRGLPDFPPQLRTLLEHMILSHHGQLEFGSPKLPMFPEAVMLHYLDDLDSKIQSFAGNAASYLLVSIKDWAGKLFDIIMGFILTIYFILEGQALMEVGNEVEPVGPGDAIAIPPGARHKIWNTGDVPLVLLCCCAPAYENDDTVMVE